MRAKCSGGLPAQKGKVYAGVAMCFSLLLTGCLLPVVARADTTLMIEGNLSRGTCDVELLTEPEMFLGVHIPAEFHENNGTVSTGNISLRVVNCEYVDPNVGNVGVMVTGSTLAGQDYIFNDDPNSDVGFMLRPNKLPGNEQRVWKGPLSDFFDDQDAIRNGDVSVEGIDPTVQGGVIVNYGVGFVATSPSALPVADSSVATAKLSFSFNYR